MRKSRGSETGVSRMKSTGCRAAKLLRAGCRAGCAPRRDEPDHAVLHRFFIEERARGDGLCIRFPGALRNDRFRTDQALSHDMMDPRGSAQKSSKITDKSIYFMCLFPNPDIKSEGCSYVIDGIGAIEAGLDDRPDPVRLHWQLRVPIRAENAPEEAEQRFHQFSETSNRLEPASRMTPLSVRPCGRSPAGRPFVVRSSFAISIAAGARVNGPCVRPRPVSLSAALPSARRTCAPLIGGRAFRHTGNPGGSGPLAPRPGATRRSM